MAEVFPEADSAVAVVEAGNEKKEGSKGQIGSLYHIFCKR